MSNSILFKSPSASTDLTLPKVSKDYILTNGSILLFDFARLSTWNPAVDVFADNAVVRNLVSGSANGLLKIPATGDLTFLTGRGFKLKDTASFGRIQIGQGTDFFQTNLSHNFVMTVWATHPPTDLISSVAGWIVAKGVSADYSLMGPFIAARYISNSFSGKLSSWSSNGLNTSAGGSPAGKHQWSVAKVGNLTSLYRDGVYLASGTNLDGDMTPNSNPITLGNQSASGYAPGGLILHRFYAEDLSISGRAPLDVVQQDYLYNSSRFN